MAQQKHDIQTLADIKNLVDTFYGKVRLDALIGPIFDERIQDRWPQHLEKMYTFWQTILLEEHTYFGAPFPPHAQLPIEKEHFDKWLQIFHATLEELFEGKIADEAKWRANKMAQMFQYKLQYFRERPDNALI